MRRGPGSVSPARGASCDAGDGAGPGGPSAGLPRRAGHWVILPTIRSPDPRPCPPAPEEIHARDRSTRRGRQAELHEGRARDPGARARRRGAGDHPQRPALRRGHVGRLLPRPRAARAGPQPGRGLRISRGPDGRHHGRPGAGVRRAPPGARGRLRRRELHDRRRARRGQDRPAAGPRGGRAAQLRHDHAGGGQPARHRHPLRPLLRHEPGGHGPPGPRGRAGRPDALRRQPDDRHAARQPRPVRPRPPARRAGPRRALRGRDAPPASQR